MRRQRLFVAGALVAVAVVASPGATLAAEPTRSTTLLQQNLQYPWDLAFTPDGRMLVTERPGYVSIFKDGTKFAPRLARVRIGSVRAEGEAGVMGIDVDPSFATNGYVYVCASRYGSTTNYQWVNQLLRYRLSSANELTFDRYIIKNGMRAGRIHNGCAVMTRSGYVFVTMGDAGNSSLAQNPASLNGKVLRATLSGGIPSTNPILPGNTARTYAISMGHRNPQGISVDPATSRIYSVEHGPDVNDEINVHTLSVARNHGWPCKTGFGQTYQSSACRSGVSYTNPVWASGGSTWATSNGTFLWGSHFGSWSGDFVVATLKEQDLRRYNVVSTSNFDHIGTYYNGSYGRLRATVTRGPYLYLTTSNGGSDKIIRVTFKTP